MKTRNTVGLSTFFYHHKYIYSFYFCCFVRTPIYLSISIELYLIRATYYVWQLNDKKIKLKTWFKPKIIIISAGSVCNFICKYTSQTQIYYTEEIIKMIDFNCCCCCCRNTVQQNFRSWMFYFYVMKLLTPTVVLDVKRAYMNMYLS